MTRTDRLFRLGGLLFIGSVLVVAVRIVLSGYEKDLAPTAAVIDEILAALTESIERRLHDAFIAKTKADGTYEDMLSRYGAQLHESRFVVNHGNSGRGYASPGFLGGRLKEVQWQVEMLTPSSPAVGHALPPRLAFEHQIRVFITLSQSWKSALREFPGKLAISDGGAPQNGLLIDPLKRQLEEKGIKVTDASY